MTKPYYDREKIASQLRNYDRTPFLDVLAAWVHYAPQTPELLQAFAARYPDRYIGAMKSLAALAGFTEQTALDLNVNLNVRDMSDSQLEDQLRKQLLAMHKAQELPSAAHIQIDAAAEPAQSAERADEPVITNPDEDEPA